MAFPTSNYPVALDTLPNRVNAVDTFNAADINAAYDAIMKIEAELGVLPKGTAASVRKRLDNLGTLGITVATYTDGSGTSAAVTTAIQQAIDAAVAADRPLVFDGGTVYVINAALNMRADGLRVRGNGAKIIQSGTNVQILLVGGEAQVIDDLTLEYGATPAGTDTNSNAIEFMNCFMSVFSNLRCNRTGRGLYLAQ